MRAASAFVLCSLVCSCAESPDTPSPGPPWLEVGAGSTAFQPLADGDDIELVMGPQGGWHLDVAVRFKAISPDGLALAYRAIDVESGDNLGFPIRSALNQDRVTHEGGGVFVRTGDRIVLDIESPAVIFERAIEIQVDARSTAVDLGAAVTIEVVDVEP